MSEKSTSYLALAMGFVLAISVFMVLPGLADTFQNPWAVIPPAEVTAQTIKTGAHKAIGGLLFIFIIINAWWGFEWKEKTHQIKSLQDRIQKLEAEKGKSRKNKISL